MTLASFVCTWLGKPCQFDGIGSAQCVDLVNQWIHDGLAREPIRANADGLLAAAPPDRWLRTANSPSNFPPPGAVVVWRAEVADLDIGPFGHCGIALLSDTMHLVTLDQNWAGQPYGAVIAHSYAGVSGWLTPR